MPGCDIGGCGGRGAHETLAAARCAGGRAGRGWRRRRLGVYARAGGDGEEVVVVAAAARRRGGGDGGGVVGFGTGGWRSEERRVGKECSW